MTKVLLISYFYPARYHAGGARLLDIYAEIRRIEPDAHLALLTIGNGRIESGDGAMRSIFDEVGFLSEREFNNRDLRKVTFRCTSFDLIDMAYLQSSRFIGVCRERWPAATLVFSPMESQVRAAKIGFSRGFRVVWRDFLPALSLLWHALTEMVGVLRADRVVTVSEPDRSALEFLKSAGRLVCLPTCVSAEQGGARRLQEQTGPSIAVFFAFFGSRTNQEALVWYCRQVHPLVCRAAPDYKLRVVGHGLDDALRKECSVANVDIVGAVNSIAEALDGAAFGIAPALSGAGTRGKIHQYAAAGLPCVASAIACEGLLYRHGESILIADCISDFAAACISMIQDRNSRLRIGDRARDLCETEYKWASWRKRIVSVYGIDP